MAEEKNNQGKKEADGVERHCCVPRPFAGGDAPAGSGGGPQRIASYFFPFPVFLVTVDADYGRRRYLIRDVQSNARLGRFKFDDII